MNHQPPPGANVDSRRHCAKRHQTVPSSVDVVVCMGRRRGLLPGGILSSLRARCHDRRTDARSSHRRGEPGQSLGLLFLLLCGDADSGRRPDRLLGAAQTAGLRRHFSGGRSVSVRLHRQLCVGMRGPGHRRRVYRGRVAGSLASGRALVPTTAVWDDIRAGAALRKPGSAVRPGAPEVGRGALRMARHGHRLLARHPLHRRAGVDSGS